MPYLRRPRSRRLVETLDVFGDLLPLQHAERLDDLEGDAAGDAGDVFGGGKREQRTEQPLDMVLEPEIEPRLHRVARRAGELLVGDHAKPRPQHVVAGDQLADRRADPAHRAVGRRARTRAPAPACSLVARASISPASAVRAAACNAFASEPAADASATNVKPSRRPISCPSTTTSPVFLISVSNVVFSRSRRINTLVRRSTNRSVRRSCIASESLSSTPRATACQCSGIGKPVRTVRHEGPGPHMRDPVRERVDIAIGPVGLRHLGGEPVGGDFTLPHQESIEGHDSSACVAGAILR